VKPSKCPTRCPKCGQDMIHLDLKDWAAHAWCGHCRYEFPPILPPAVRRAFAACRRAMTHGCKMLCGGYTPRRCRPMSPECLKRRAALRAMGRAQGKEKP